MAAPMQFMFTYTFIILFLVYGGDSRQKFTEKDIEKYRDRVARMFQHAYSGYLRYAYPYDELRPLSCDGYDTWGSYSLTLVDALDTLAIMGNFTEFRRVAVLLAETLNFDKDINVSVFETNIRVVGGLLSGHLLSKRAEMELEPGWPCSGPLLRMAEKVARKLLPAFNTTTGMPYGTVNLRYGVPKGETPITCTAGIGTFLVEFGALTRLTGDPVFERVALQAMEALHESRSSLDLLGNHIDVETGKWTALDAGIGAGVDSYFEYLVKGAILFQKPELMDMFNGYVSAIELYLKREDWYMWAHMRKGTVTLPIFQSLEAFWPGMQSLVGEIEKGMKTLHNYHQVWKQYGFTPEFYNIPKVEAQSGREGYPLRPELIESTMYLYQATRDPYLLEVGVDILESIELNARTPCGYATVKDVRDHRLENRMESFFLAETTKYLYLLFDPDHFIHNSGGQGTVINTPNGECVIDAGGYVFNTEAHPVDAAALYCCSAEKKVHDQTLQDFHDNVDLLALLDLVDHTDELFGSKLLEKRVIKQRKKKPKLGVIPPERLPTQESTTLVMSSHDGGHQYQSSSVPVSPKSQANHEIPVDTNPNSKINDVLSQVLKSLETLSDTKLKLVAPAKENEDSSVSNEKNRSPVTESQANDSQENAVVPDSPLLGNTYSSPKNEVTITSQGTSEANGMDTSEDSGTVPTGIVEEPKEYDEESDICRPEDKDDEEAKLAREEALLEDLHDTDARLLSCPAQPFHMRLSLMGEMFGET